MSVYCDCVWVLANATCVCVCFSVSTCASLRLCTYVSASECKCLDVWVFCCVLVGVYVYVRVLLGVCLPNSVSLQLSLTVFAAGSRYVTCDAVICIRMSVTCPPMSASMCLGMRLWCAFVCALIVSRIVVSAPLCVVVSTWLYIYLYRRVFE